MGSFTGSSLSTSTGSFSSSDLIQQILLAIQPQVAQAVQSVISSQSTVSSGAVNNQESFQSFTGNSQFGSSDSTQFGTSAGSSQFGSSAGSNRFESSDSSQFGSSGSSQFGSSGSTGSQGNTFST